MTLPTLSSGPSHYERLIAYYEEAGPDFAEWSAGLNMHFGYFRAGLNPFRREAMLNEMNRQVVERLGLNSAHDDLIVDLGCGVGATVRYAASRFERTRVLGLTVVPWQVEIGNQLNRRAGLFPRAALELKDYTQTGLRSASVAGAYGIESACHAEGADKQSFVREAARVLRPGATLVVADGFLRKPRQSLGALARRLHDLLCRSFVLPQLAEVDRFAEALAANGFDEIRIEDASLRVAPSALHAPFAVPWFLLKRTLRGEILGEWRLNNLKGSLVSPALGALLSACGYFLVSARRK
jgi:cyclopropane fatty-acyl-phospholipid synthase-like methyltransferase